MARVNRSPYAVGRGDPPETEHSVIRKHSADMTARFSTPTAAPLGGAGQGRAFACREIRETRGSQPWRGELVEMLQAQLTNLDSMVHGFSPSAARRVAGV